MEDTVKDLEKRWAEIQDKALKQPSPGIFNWSPCRFLSLFLCKILDIENFYSSESENVGQTAP